MVKHITASEIADYWSSLFKKEKDENSNNKVLELGNEIHELILSPLERVSRAPRASCNDYEFLFNKGLDKAEEDEFDQDVIDELRENMSGNENILERIDVHSPEEISKVRVEESLRVNPNVMYARADILRTEPVIVYNIKTGNYPEKGGYRKHCIQLAAEAFVTWHQFGKLDGAFLIYTKAKGEAGKPRLINPMNYFDDVVTCVGGILSSRKYNEKERESYIDFLRKVKYNFKMG